MHLRPWLLAASLLAAPALPHLDDLASFRAALAPHGRAALVHFWALWCGPCMAELPSQVALARAAQDAGADVLFVNLDGFDREADVQRELAALDAGTAARHVMLNMSLETNDITHVLSPTWSGTIPATFVKGKDGAVKDRVIGPASGKEESRLLRVLRLAGNPRAR